MCGAALSCLALCSRGAGAAEWLLAASRRETPAGVAVFLASYDRRLTSTSVPISGWNGKFYEVGCGGFCGTLDSDIKDFANAPNYAWRRNYATAVTDAGHWGSGSVDGRWAFNNLLAKDDWAWRAEAEVARVGKALVGASTMARRKTALSRQTSIGHFRPRIARSAVPIHEQKQ
jgi:Tannase and feruloyl esterase